MSASEQDTMALMAAVATACAVPGVFLVLRRLSLVGDAISHVLLFGIVAAYFVVGDLTSPWLLAGAAASGVLTVALVELLQRSKLVKEDAAIGLVFPALFSMGALLASMNFRETHLDVDQVLLGHAELASQADPVYVGGVYLGRAPAVRMAAIAFVNCTLLILFYKELKLTTFDAGIAATFGFMPVVMHYALMTAVSVSAVMAFDAVGPVLVVAFLVVPAATARLLTDRLSKVIVLAPSVAHLGAVCGVRFAYLYGTNTAGSVASALAGLFALAFLFGPRGAVANAVRRRRARADFLVTMLVVHLYQHEATPAAADECDAAGLHRHLHWPPHEVDRVTGRAGRAGVVTRSGPILTLTPAGRARAAAVFGPAPGAVQGAAGGI